MTSTDQQRVVQWMKDRIGKYAYSQQPGRLSPDSSGFTDCSALVRFAYQQIMGPNFEVGTWTGDQQRYGSLVFGTNQESYDAAVSSLQPGDLIFFDWDGYGVQSFDHVEMYIGNGQTIGHGGPGRGPIIKDFRQQWNWASHVAARRYIRNLAVQAPVEAQKPAPEPTKKLEPIQQPVSASAPALPQPFPLRHDHYYGLITGPDQSHGGYYDSEKPVVKIIQQRLIAKGYVPGITDINSSWADGIFEQPTADAVAAFQRAEMPGTTYYGQVWWDDYAKLSQ